MMDALTPIDVTLDLPVAPSVNRTRRVNWYASKLIRDWKAAATAALMAARYKPQPPIERFELWITVSEDHTKCDLDNALKVLIDYLRWIEVIENDAKKNMRGIHIVWGHASEGCRVTIRKVA